MRSVAAAIGSFVFFWLAPGTVAGLIPYWLTDWRAQSLLAGMWSVQMLGGVGAGVAIVVACFWRFAREGRGTPAPIAPTETLIVSGLYRYVRNPMYVGVLTTLGGQALLFGSRALVIYAAGVWLLFHAFVLIYEEPRLRRRYGAAYDRYSAKVRRWRPRITAWQGPSSG